MDWTRVKQKIPTSNQPAGVYANLQDMIRIRFKARDFSLKPTQPVNSILSGRYASRLRGRGLNFEELRRYQPGDDIRNIDWKVTARTRSPHIRVYSEEKDRTVLLVVDQRKNMFFGTRNRMKSVTATELAALGAWRALDSGDRIGAVAFNDNEVAEIKPQRSQKTVMSIFHSIIKMNHQLSIDHNIQPNPEQLNEALMKARKLMKHDSLVIIISDFFGVNEQTRKLVTQLAQHNDILGILVHDPIRLNPMGPNIDISDGLLQFTLKLGSKKTRQKIVEEYQQEQAMLEENLRQLSAPLLLISNEGDVVEQVRHLLGFSVTPPKWQI
jgi:uncharacterized protein (DUF58 family)